MGRLYRVYPCLPPPFLKLRPPRLESFSLCHSCFTPSQHCYSGSTGHQMSASAAARTGLFKNLRFHIGPRTLRSQGVSIDNVKPVFDCGKTPWWARWTYFLVAADIFTTYARHVALSSPARLMTRIRQSRCMRTYMVPLDGLGRTAARKLAPARGG